MAKVIIVLVILVVVAVVVVVMLAAGKPNTFRIERSVSIKATPDKISPYIANFHQWTLWSPFEKLDPTMKRTFSGPMVGKGALYAWEGNSKAGAGSMEIVESTPLAITIELNFSKPMKAQNITEITFTPSGDGTNVTWAMHVNSSYVAKIFHVFINMDKMVGTSFDEGLAKLKEVAEKK